MPRVYMAGAIQHSRSHGKGWRALVKRDYPQIEWCDPIEKYDSMSAAREWEDERVVAEDKALIDGCDAMLIHYEVVPSHGTPREQEYAWHLRKTRQFVDELLSEGVPQWKIHNALDRAEMDWPTDVPVFVQTTAEDPSPWLTVDAECVVETFGEAVDCIEEYFKE